MLKKQSSTQKYVTNELTFWVSIENKIVMSERNLESIISTNKKHTLERFKKNFLSGENWKKMS